MEGHFGPASIHHAIVVACRWHSSNMWATCDPRALTIRLLTDSPLPSPHFSPCTMANLEPRGVDDVPSTI